MSDIKKPRKPRKIERDELETLHFVGKGKNREEFADESKARQWIEALYMARLHVEESSPDLKDDRALTKAIDVARALLKYGAVPEVSDQETEADRAGLGEDSDGDSSRVYVQDGAESGEHLNGSGAH